MQDEQLDYWAEKFIGAGLRSVMTFGAFMKLSVPMRERRIHQAAQAAVIQERFERAIPDAALHGAALIDPMRHGPRSYKRPWFYGLHNHL